jgi:hypothetical protein
MNDNPYEAPKSVSAPEDLTAELDNGLSLLRQLAKLRRIRRRWNYCCYGLAVFFSGLATLACLTMPMFQNSGGAFVLVRLLAVLSVAIALIVFVLGPLSWFWFGSRPSTSTE